MLVGLVLLPGVQGFATVADVPVVDEGEDDAVVVEALPMLPVDGVEPVVGEVEAVVLPVLVLFDGVQGAEVEVVPLPLVLLLPVTLPGLLELVDPGVVVCSVPMEPVDPVPVEVVPGEVEVVPDGVDVVPGAVEVVPGAVEVVPCGVEVVPDGVDVVVLGVAGLGVTVPVVWADATPIASANTDEANRIFLMNLTPFTSAWWTAERREDASLLQIQLVLGCNTCYQEMSQPELLNTLFLPGRVRSLQLFCALVQAGKMDLTSVYSRACTLQ